MRLYEGLFLIEAGRAARDWEGAESELVSVLERHGVAIQQKTRYDERKLAYPVEGFRRGAYLLAYFEAEPSAIAEINTDLNLCEAVLRSLILRFEGDGVPEPGPLGNMEPMRPGEVPRRLADEAQRAASRAKAAEVKVVEAVPPEVTPAKGAPAAEEAPAGKEAPGEPAAGGSGQEGKES